MKRMTEKERSRLSCRSRCRANASRCLSLAAALRSAALRADAYETVTCTWLSAATLAGLVLNAWVGWSWADPVAALLLVPVIVREGREGLTGGELA
jgi:hypothetical protein